MFVLLGMVLPAFGNDPEWVEVRSSHFSVVTDAGERRGRETALRFEQMRAVFGALMTKKQVTIPVPLQIVAFRDGNEMRRFVPLWQGKPVQVSGLFQASNDRCFIILDMAVDDPWQVVFHEYAHQLLNGNTGPQSQPWFDEGFAEFFSSIKVKGKEAEIGLPVENDWHFLQKNSLMDVADLFRVRHNSSIYSENGDRRSLFYAESWLLVHYLYDHRWLSKLPLYFALGQREIGIDESIRQAFGMSALYLNNRLRDYLSRDQLRSYRVSVDSVTDGSKYVVRRLAITEVQAVLADVHVHSADYQGKAVAEFEGVLKVEPENAAALRGLGYAYFIKHQYQQAAECFSKALKHDSDDPRLLYYSALLAQSRGPGLSSDREQLRVVKEQLEKAVALDPEYADAYRLLALTYASLGKKDQALQIILKAVDLNPRNERYLLNRAQLYMVDGKYDESIAALEELCKAHDHEIAEQAEKELSAVREIKRASLAGVPVDARLGTADAAAEFIRRERSDPHAAGASVPAAEITQSPAEFIRGKLEAVDCSASPEAVLTVVSGAKTLKLHARDDALVIVIGADKFSCEWTNQKVAVNYRETAEDCGEIISIELQ
ncbi:MAG TPA: tetratricopeptide repeat protein [Terriglobales bacterium]|nr:tetratricopeptide repeat protein [Terriglobales bacterium]